MELGWLKNTDGKKSASLTMVVVAFTIVMLHMLISIFVNPFGIAIAPFDASGSMMVLSPLLGLYFGRRHTESKEKIAHKTPKPDTSEKD